MTLAHYRHDITGLRAIAALAILVFHIDPRFSGGFIGVDIFFVISGYLITRNIWPALQNQNFSFSTFYAKRFRRLFPAYASVLACSFIVILIFGLNSEITHFGASALSSLFYVSNIYFLSVSDYFAPQMQLNPLLHTWSLSVEEQFYFVFPAFLLLCSRANNIGFRIFLGIAILSFVLSQVLLTITPSASFYLSPSRFWQFMLGGMLALSQQRIISKNFALALALFCYVTLAGCFIFYTEHIAFPGFYALFPTLATAGLLLAGTTHHSLSFLLSNPLFRFFGNISYSLYLVHWPMIVFYKLMISPTFEARDKVTIFIASVILGYVNWRFVEQKCLKVSLVNRNKHAAFLAAISMTLFAIPLLLAAHTSVFHSESQSQMDKWLDYDMNARTGICFITSSTRTSRDIFDEQACAPKENSTSPKLLLMGDSHAAQYYSALVSLLPNYDIHQFTATGCRPVLDEESEEVCYQIMAKAYHRLLRDSQYDIVVIAGRWWEVDLPKLNKSLDAIKQLKRKVFLIGPVPEYKQSLPILLSRYGEESTTLDKVSKLPDRKRIEAQLLKLAYEYDITYLSAIDAMCSKRNCIKTLEINEPIQFDYGHLTHNGAVYVLRRTLMTKLTKHEKAVQ